MSGITGQSGGGGGDNLELFIEEGRRYVVAEDERSRTFQTAATTLVAAIGVILSISLALGDRLHDRNLFLAHWLTDGLYGAGILLLLVAGAFALSAVFPSAGDSGDYELMALRQQEPMASQPFETTRNQLVQRVTLELGQGKVRNGKSLSRTKVAAFPLAAGAVVIAFIGTTIALTPKKPTVAHATSQAVSKKSKKGRRIVTHRESKTTTSP
jgi:hypothetical protein